VFPRAVRASGTYEYNRSTVRRQRVAMRDESVCTREEGDG